MNVLHVIRDLAVSTGGPAVALRGLAEAQARSGLGVAILATDHGGATVALPQGVEVETIKAWPGSWGFSPALGRALDRKIRRADIVHLHMVWDFPVWEGARAALRHQKPFILRPCGQLDAWSLAQKAWKKRAYFRLLGSPLRRAAAIHFTTAGEREGSRGAVGDAHSFVIPIGVSETAWRDLPPRTAFARRFPELAEKRVVLFLGRLHPKKQPDILIDAFARIAENFPDAHLVLAGPGDTDFLAALRARARDRAIGGQTTLTGPLSGTAVTEAFRAAEIFALPSLQENFGIAIVEAMAAGCPVLVSDRVDLAKEIAAADAGLVRPATVEDFSEGLRTLLGDPAGGARMGANGHALVQRNYTWEPIAARLSEAYRGIVDQSPAAASSIAPA